jgi:hypothetical protein
MDGIHTVRSPENRMPPRAHLGALVADNHAALEAVARSVCRVCASSTATTGTVETAARGLSSADHTVGLSIVLILRATVAATSCPAATTETSGVC